MRFITRSIGPLTVAILLAASLPVHAQQPHDDQRDVDQPIVIGHRGASGYVPEHTLVAYFLPSSRAPITSNLISS